MYFCWLAWKTNWKSGRGKKAKFKKGQSKTKRAKIYSGSTSWWAAILSLVHCTTTKCHQETFLGCHAICWKSNIFQSVTPAGSQYWKQTNTKDRAIQWMTKLPKAQLVAIGGCNVYHCIPKFKIRAIKGVIKYSPSCLWKVGGNFIVHNISGALQENSVAAFC